MIRHNFSASRVMAFVLGAFTGYLGIEHGYFEILQGNIRPTGMMIRAMGTPCQAATSPVGCEPAMTIMPNFLVTGVLAILVSLAIITWQGLRVSRKHGSIGLILLSILLLFVGGGFTPLPFGILAGVACAGINASPAGWQAHLPVILRGVLAKLWPWLLLISMICILEWII